MIFKLISLIIFSISFPVMATNKIAQSIPQPDIRHKTVVKGDNLYKILSRNKFPAASINNILRRHPHLRKFILSPGQVYTIHKNLQQINLSLYIELGQKLLFWQKLSSNRSGVKRIPDQLSTKLHTIQGTIKGSLFASITNKINDSLIPYKFQDAFLLHYDLTKIIQPKAPFSFNIEKKYYGKKFIKYGQITHAQIELNGTLIERNLVKHNKGFSYIGPENEINRPFYSPVDYLHFASLYKKRRFHPVKKRYMAHQGIDFALKQGRSIYAVQAGKVIKRGKARVAGNYIAIKHANGYTSYYNHLSRHHKDIRIGQKVIPGQTIGWIGCTGSCTKPHLHFAIKKNNRYVNPIKLIKSFPFLAEKNISQYITKNR